MDIEDPNRSGGKTYIPNRNDVSILRGTDESMETTRRPKRKFASGRVRGENMICCLRR